VVRTVHRDDVHPRQHLVETFPIGRAQFLGDARRDGTAVVVMDLQAERVRPARHRLADTAHADDAEPLSSDAGGRASRSATSPPSSCPR